MRKSVLAAVLAALLLWIPLCPAAAAEAGYTLRIDGGKTAEHLEVIDGTPCLRVDLFCDGVSDGMLLSTASFAIRYSTKQLAFLTDSQARGVYSLTATDKSGASQGTRSLFVQDGDGAVRFAFASDYGCRIEEGMPLISLYFRFASVLKANAAIGFTLESGAAAESVRKKDQKAGGDLVPTARTVTADFSAFRVSAFRGTAALRTTDVQFKGETPYVVYTGKAQKPRVTVKDASGAEVDPVFYRVSYTGNKLPGTAKVKVTFRNGYGGSAAAWFKIYLSPTAKTRVGNTADGIRIEWAAVPGAKGYVIYRRAWNRSSADWTVFERWNNTTETAWTDPNGAPGTPGVYAGTRYQYGVKAYFDDPMNNYDLGLVGPLKTTVRITTRTLTRVKAGTGRMTVKWDASGLFTGYELRYAADRAFKTDAVTVRISNAATAQRTVKGLPSGRTVYVQVRSYHIFEGTAYYGGWSETKSCRIR